MGRTKKIFNGNLVLLISFSMLIAVSMVLMLLKASEFRIIPGDLGSADFKVKLTPDYVIIENPYGNIIASYSISTSSSTVSPKEASIEVFPLRLPRVIEAYNKTVYISSWDFHVYNVLRVNYTEVKGGYFLQKTYAVDLRLRLEDLSYTDSSFKTVFEIIETPHEPGANEILSGSLKPLTGQLYGGFYLLSSENMKIVINWEPADKPIVATVYHEEGKIENYLLKDGEWSGFIKAVDTGLNCLIVWNPSQNGNITYYGMILNP